MEQPNNIDNEEEENPIDHDKAENIDSEDQDPNNNQNNTNSDINSNNENIDKLIPNKLSKPYKTKENSHQNDDDSSNENEKNDDEDDILNKINDEANKIGEDLELNSENLKIFSKYDNLSDNQLKSKVKEMNDSILKLNNQIQDSKTKLNTLLKSLNQLISENEDLLYYKETNPENTKQLERKLEIRKKDLDFSKKTNKNLQKRYNIISNKAKIDLSTDKANILEQKIDELKDDNTKIINQIRELKDKSNIQSKELEICISNKKYPNKIVSCSQDVYSLSSKKYEYHHKIEKNKHTLENVIKSMKKLEEVYNANIKEDSNEIIVNRINEWIELLKDDLTGSVDDILLKIDSNESKVINAIDRDREKRKENNKNDIETETNLPLLDKYTNNNSSNNVFIRGNNVNNNQNGNGPSGPKQYGIFAKYNYLKKSKVIGIPKLLDKSKKSLTVKYKNASSLDKKNYHRFLHNDYKSNDSNYQMIMASNSNNKQNNNLTIKNSHYSNNSSNSKKKSYLNTESSYKNSTKNTKRKLDTEDLLNNDYNATKDEDFNELLMKKEEYSNVVMRLDKTRKELEKMGERKIKDISYSIGLNSKKLESLKLSNDLLNNEIANLNKIYELTKEQHKLKKELKRDESKFIKSINPTQQSHMNENSITENFLQELGGLNCNNSNLNNNDKSKNLKKCSNDNISTNIVEMVDGHNNKNLKFPDISRVEKVEEVDEDGMNDRDKKIMEIKMKYNKLDGDGDDNNELDNLDDSKDKIEIK